MQEEERNWFAPLIAAGAQELWVRRGFVEAVRLAGRSVAEVGLVCRREPVLELRLTSGGPGPLALAAAAPELHGLRRLRIDGRHATGVELMLASSGLSELESLWLNHSVTPRFAEAMTASGARPVDLSLHLDSGGALRLVASPFLTRLTRLHLNGADDETMVALADAPLADLRSLRLWQSAVGVRAVEALGGRLDHLTELSLMASRLDPAAVPIMVEHMVSGRLRTLEVTGVPCDALAELLASPAMSGVEELDLSYGPFTARVAAALRRSVYLDRLRRLNIVDGDRAVSRGFRLPGVEVTTEGW